MAEEKPKKTEDTSQQTSRDSKESGQKATPAQETTEKVWDKVTSTLQKGVDAIREGVEKVGQFAGDAAKVGRLRLEIHTLRSDLNDLHARTGARLWEMHKEKKLKALDKAFAQELKQMGTLLKDIQAREKEMEKA